MNLLDDAEELQYIGIWELHDPLLAALVREVLGRIPDEVEDEFHVFNVFEDTSPWGAYVNDGSVFLDPRKLLAESRDVAIGTIAHELAHVYLRHPMEGGLDDEYAADDLARSWGFVQEVKAMRDACGPPTVK